MENGGDPIALQSPLDVGTTLLPHLRLRSYLTADEQPVLEVANNGPGMDLNNLNSSVFQLFSRQHTNVERTRVRLYLVQRIVRSHGGRIEVVSTPGLGTTFTIYWTARK